MGCACLRFNHRSDGSHASSSSCVVTESRELRANTESREKPLTTADIEVLEADEDATPAPIGGDDVRAAECTRNNDNSEAPCFSSSASRHESSPCLHSDAWQAVLDGCDSDLDRACLESWMEFRPKRAVSACNPHEAILKVFIPEYEPDLGRTDCFLRPPAPPTETEESDLDSRIGRRMVDESLVKYEHLRKPNLVVINVSPCMQQAGWIDLSCATMSGAEAASITVDPHVENTLSIARCIAEKLPEELHVPPHRLQLLLPNGDLLLQGKEVLLAEALQDQEQENAELP
eukprot:TRINITY_DN82797_c0_g1_i1.p1 TRINITY_DN82797_c0_g1~~TRINITY_DN82797_c0_g1_i1.p1  ORF type:complete len:298 (+),score=58.61 TRINITY_DN82797_c0_g1_i1:29-895(+)